ncbi:MAG: helix-turn-helix domain-containing protein [Bacteroidota bacterium]
MSEQIRKIENGRWYWIDKEVIQKHVSKIGYLAMCVYHFLASMVDETQHCFPSQQYMAEHLGCSRASVSRAIHRLKTAGLVSVSKGESNHAVYCLLKIRDSTDATGMSHERTKDVAPVNTNNTTLPIINNNFLDSPKQLTEKGKSLLQEISATVGDPDNEKFLPIVRRYDEKFVKEILSQVRNTGNIKKSRTALFFYLVKYYAKRRS